MIEAAQLVNGDEGVAYALEHRFEIQVFLIPRHLFQLSVTGDEYQLGVQFACMVEWGIVVYNGQGERYLALFANGVVRGALSLSITTVALLWL